MNLPLQGIRVIDLTTTLAGPYCTHILATLGADVIKLERLPFGDEARRGGPPFWGEDSSLFLSTNPGKRSLAVDLKSADGLRIVSRLVHDADVFVQNLRPGAVERLKLGFDDLRTQNDKLVYCSLGAFGKPGPREHEPGYDPLMQAAAGIMSTTAEPGRPPIRTGPSFVDIGTGMWAAIGVLSALIRRDEMGRAQLVDTSLYEVAVNFQPMQIAGYLATGVVPAPLGRAQTLLVPLETFATADSDIVVAAGTDRLFACLCDALGKPEWASDPRFRTNSERVANHSELSALLGACFRSAGTAEWLRRLRDAAVPVSAVTDIAGVVEDPHFQALGLLQDIPGSRVEGLRLIAPPLLLDGQRLPLRFPPPMVGEQSHEVLTQLGYSPHEIACLESDGVIAGQRP